MSAQHKRPMAAFVVLTLLAVLMIGYQMKVNGVPGVVPGSDREIVAGEELALTPQVTPTEEFLAEVIGSGRSRVLEPPVAPTAQDKPVERRSVGRADSDSRPLRQPSAGSMRPAPDRTGPGQSTSDEQPAPEAVQAEEQAGQLEPSKPQPEHAQADSAKPQQAQADSAPPEHAQADSAKSGNGKPTSVPSTAPRLSPPAKPQTAAGQNQQPLPVDSLPAAIVKDPFDCEDWVEGHAHGPFHGWHDHHSDDHHSDDQGSDDQGSEEQLAEDY